LKKAAQSHSVAEVAAITAEDVVMIEVAETAVVADVVMEVIASKNAVAEKNVAVLKTGVDAKITVGLSAENVAMIAADLSAESVPILTTAQEETMANRIDLDAISETV
jgi:hypothetical protein